MKLIKENKLLVLLCSLVLLLAGACQHISEEEMLIGRWHYLKVINKDTALFPILDSDYMQFKSDSTFHYEIAASRKSNKGKWKYTDHRLTLMYSEPDTARIFSIEIISKHDLIFNEGSKHFVLKRAE